MVIVKDYDENWPKLFESEKKIILKAIEKWTKGIEHIGSTAVPHLPAKPTIDICIGVDSLEDIEHRVIEPLQRLGYELPKELGTHIPGRRYLQKLDGQGEHLFHLHIVVIGSRLWNEYIGFRDYLIANHNEAKAYSDLKYALQKQFPQDRHAYAQGKARFINVLLSKINNRRN